MTLSYSQQFEDILLRRLFPHDDGFFIDIGANDPVDWSVTKLFSDLGWHGINVEPGAIYEKLVAGRPRDINLQVAVSNVNGEMPFFEFPDAHGLSTLSMVEAAEHRQRGFRMHERKVPVMTLAQICEQHASDTIDFLSVDVEGHEREVLMGGDWRRFRPICVIIESTRPCSTVPTHQQWESILTSAGYLLGNFDGLNRYYIRAENAALMERLQTPVNVFDGAIAFHALSRPTQEFVTALLNEKRQLASDKKSISEFSGRQEDALNHLRKHIAWLEPQLEHHQAESIANQLREEAYRRLQQEMEELRQSFAQLQSTTELQIANALEQARIDSVKRQIAEALVEGLQKTIDAARSREQGRAA